MRILFLTSRLPYPPTRGDRLRAFNFLKILHQQHDIHLITFVSRDEEIQYINKLIPYCTQIKYIKKRPHQSALSVLLNVWRPMPLQSLYYRSAKMGSLIQEEIKLHKYDVIYVHLFRMAQFVIDPESQYRILDLTDLISREINRSLQYRSRLWKLIYSIDYPRIMRYETQSVRNFEETWLISPSDMELLKTKMPEANIHNITNGIDLNIFHPLDQKPISNQILFSGHMGIPHNIDAARYFARDIFPGVMKMYPESQFVIAGAEPDQSVISLSHDPNVKVLGYVDDLNLELNRSHVFVAPLRFAAGVQNKVLEAMAAGRPVVASSIVNEGLNAREEDEILIANTREEFITQLIRLFNDESLCTRIGTSGMDFVRKNFSWDNVLQHMNILETKLTGNIR